MFISGHGRNGRDGKEVILSANESGESYFSLPYFFSDMLGLDDAEKESLSKIPKILFIDSCYGRALEYRSSIFPKSNPPLAGGMSRSKSSENINAAYTNMNHIQGTKIPNSIIFHSTVEQNLSPNPSKFMKGISRFRMFT